MSDSAPLLRALRTPFNAVKTAPQDIDFAIDPSFGLTRRRYGWYSNNSLFDGSFVLDGAGAIEISTTATTSDTARIRSAYAGQYVSQALAVPGQAMHITSGVSEDAGRYSLDNGIVAVGVGWHDGSTGGWGVNPGPIQTFLGLKWDTSGLQAICVSDGEHVGGSPVDQGDFNIDPFDASGPTGNVLDPSFGYIYNQPYTWYNEGALTVGVVDPEDDIFWPLHRFQGLHGTPSLDRPNMPNIVVVDNDGAAATTSVEVGGMQYSRYGSTEKKDRQRQTPITRITSGGYISNQVVTSNNAIDAGASTPVPLVAYQRRTDRHLEMRGLSPTIRASDDLYIFLFDEFDYATASDASSNFRAPHPVTDPKESGIEVDSEATTYTPTQWTFRGLAPVEGGNDNQADLQNIDIESRVPIDATRVMAAVHRGNAADITAMRHNVIEGY